MYGIQVAHIFIDLTATLFQQMTKYRNASVILVI